MKKTILLFASISLLSLNAAAEAKPEKGDFDKKRAEMREKMKDMSPEERKEFMEKRRAEMKARVEAMSPEDRQQFFEKVTGRMMEKGSKHLDKDELAKVESLSAEEKFRFFQQKRKEMHEKIMNMSPEEREAFKKRRMAERESQKLERE